jgi:hypothetical protein
MVSAQANKFCRLLLKRNSFGCFFPEIGWVGITARPFDEPATPIRREAHMRSLLPSLRMRDAA